jgi:rhodanese-related sulfurtransferase
MSKSFSERVAQAKASVSAVSPQQAKQLSESSRVVFVDPRPAEAIASTTGIIEGATNVTLDDISSGNLPAALSDKSTHVIASCQAGPMGAIAAHELSNLGFGNVNYIDGGTQGWLDAGYTTA